jgi:uncharacterized protein YjiS (DUF1127 family)
MSAIYSVYSSERDYASGRADAPRRISLIEAVLRGISMMAERHRSRRALLAMTDEQLKDIGISRADAEREGLRNPWE